MRRIPPRIVGITDLHMKIEAQKRRLDLARHSGDPLKIELAENGLNSLLEELSHLSHVTNKEQHQ